MGLGCLVTIGVLCIPIAIISYLSNVFETGSKIDLEKYSKDQKIDNLKKYLIKNKINIVDDIDPTFPYQVNVINAIPLGLRSIKEPYVILCTNIESIKLHNEMVDIFKLKPEVADDLKSRIRIYSEDLNKLFTDFYPNSITDRIELPEPLPWRFTKIGRFMHILLSLLIPVSIFIAVVSLFYFMWLKAAGEI